MSCCFTKLYDGQSAIKEDCAVNFSHCGFFSFPPPCNLSIQALVVSAAMNLHSVAVLCNIMYTSFTLYISFLFSYL